MRVALLGAKAGHERHGSHLNDHRADRRADRVRTHFDQNELSLPGADQVEIDLRQEFGVEQGAVLGAARIVDATTRTKIVQPVGRRRDTCAAPAAACRPAARAAAAVLPARSSSALRKPRSNKALCATSGASPMNADQFLGDLGEERLVLEKLDRQAMDRDRLRRHVALRIDDSGGSSARSECD